MQAIFRHLLNTADAPYCVMMRDVAHQQTVPTVSRVTADTIIDLVYDREQRQTGLAVSRFGGLWNIEQEVRVGTGEVLVPYSPNNNLIANDCVVLASRPEEFGFKDELLGDIGAYLHRYVDLSPLFERIAAHYILLTWVYDAFSEVPYLRLRGDYGTGKTRALMTIGSLCYKGFFASGASTTSPIFHTLDAFGGTLLLDEADFRFSDATADLVKILNNGSVRGLPVLRTMVNRHKEFDPRAFKVFGPKIIAMRGAFTDKALESRFLTEETGLRTLRQDIPIHVPPEFRLEAQSLRNRLLHFRLCNLFKIRTDPTVVSAAIAPRLNQTALSLLSIVDDPVFKIELGAELVRQNRVMLEDRRSGLEGDVVEALRDCFAANRALVIPVGAIADRVNKSTSPNPPVSNKQIGSVLRNKLHIPTYKSNGVYVVARLEQSKVQALVSRFGLTLVNTA